MPTIVYSIEIIIRYSKHSSSGLEGVSKLSDPPDVLNPMVKVYYIG